MNAPDRFVQILVVTLARISASVLKFYLSLNCSSVIKNHDPQPDPECQT